MRMRNLLFPFILAGISFSFIKATPIPILAASDTFSDGTGKSFQIDKASTNKYLTMVGDTLKIENEKYLFSGANHNEGAILSTTQKFKNFELELDIKSNIQSSSTTTWIGVTFGYQTPELTTYQSNDLIYFDGSNQYYSPSPISSSALEVGNVTPFSSVVTTYTYKIRAVDGKIRHFFGEKGKELTKIVHASNAYVTNTGDDCYINASHEGKIGVTITTMECNFYVSKFKVINLDHLDDPEADQIEDTTSIKEFHFDRLGNPIKGYISSSNSIDPTYHIKSDETGGKVTLDENSGEFVFTPGELAPGNYDFIYEIHDALGRVKEGTISFLSRTRLNSPLLKKNTPVTNYTYHFGNLDQDTMPIIGYVAPQASLNTNNQTQYNYIKESGINTVVALNEYAGSSEASAALTYADNAGVNYISRIQMADKANPAGSDLDKYFTNGVFDDYKTHESFAGFFTLDEPLTPEYTGNNNQYNAVAHYFEKMRGTGYINYSNLFPNYAMIPPVPSQGYDYYVQQYINHCHPDYLSYDNYFAQWAFPNVARTDTTGTNGNWFYNLDSIERMASNNEIPFMSFHLSTGHMSYRVPTRADMQWDVNTSLAFGAKGVLYFTYQMPKEWVDGSTDTSSWYSKYGGFVDENGNKTTVFSNGKEINEQVNRMDHVLMNSQRVDLFSIGNSPLPLPSSVRSGNSSREMSNLSSNNDLLVGTFDRNGKTSFYIVNNNLTSSASGTATFINHIEANAYFNNGTYAISGTKFDFSLDAGEAVLLELTNYENDYINIDVPKGCASLDKSEAYYTGGAIKPNVTCKYANDILVENVDYALTYKNNINPGKASVEVSYMGIYKGSETLEFTIKNIDMSKVQASLTVNEYTYTGKEIKPLPVISYESSTLELDKDYSLEYENNIDLGNGKVKIIFNSPYTGSKELSFKITKVPNYISPTPISNLTFNGVLQNLINPGSVSVGGEIKYSLDGSEFSQTIPQGKDAKQYTIYYKVFATDPLYTDSPVYSFNAEISKINAEFINVQSKKYTGSALSPDLPISLDNIEIDKITIRDNKGNIISSAIDEGKYYFTYEILDSTNVNGCKTTIEFNIVKNQEIVSFIKPIANGLTFNNQEQEVAKKGKSENGTLLYSLSLESNFTSEMPKVKNAGVYTLYYKCVSNDPLLYSDSEIFAMSIEIKKAAASYQINQYQEFEYTGGKVCISYPISSTQNVSLISIKNMNNESLSEIKKTGSYIYTFSFEENDNYKGIEVIINVKIKENLLSFAKESGLFVEKTTDDEISKQYYEIKINLMRFSQSDIETFKTDETYSSERELYNKYSRKLGDKKPFENDYSYLTKEVVQTTIDYTGTIVLGCATGSLAILCVVLLILKKKPL